MGFSFKRLGRSISRRVIKPVFNPVKSISSTINEKILNPAFIKPLEKVDDTVDALTSGKAKNFLRNMSEIYRSQMLGLAPDQILEQERNKLQKFLELKGSPRIQRVQSVGQLGHAMGLVMQDIGENMRAMRLARESGALSFSEGGKISYSSDAPTFRKFMENKRMKEIEALRGPGPESAESLIGRVQQLGQAGPQTFTPTDTSFSNFLSRTQGPQNSGKKGK
jgi:hypothetical protein